MISASKTTFSLQNVKFLGPRFQKSLLITLNCFTLFSDLVSSFIIYLTKCLQKESFIGVKQKHSILERFQMKFESNGSFISQKCIFCQRLYMLCLGLENKRKVPFSLPLFLSLSHTHTHTCTGSHARAHFKCSCWKVLCKLFSRLVCK